jgi:hypothetical protein
MLPESIDLANMAFLVGTYGKTFQTWRAGSVVLESELQRLRIA